MKITAARGAIAITLDRPRILFFDMAATWLLVQEYGTGFVRELYTLDGKGVDRVVKLKNPTALRFFLWAGLQAEISDTGENLTLEDAAGFIHPWTLENIFNALVMAVTGGVSTPVAPGKAEAPALPEKVVARRATLRKDLTSLKRSGSRVAG